VRRRQAEVWERAQHCVWPAWVGEGRLERREQARGACLIGAGQAEGTGPCAAAVMAPMVEGTTGGGLAAAAAALMATI